MSAETSRMNVGFVGGQAQKRRACNFAVWTLDRVTNFVYSRGLAPKVEDGLLKILRTYPMGAYEHFVKNIDRLTQRVHHEIFMSED